LWRVWTMMNRDFDPYDILMEVMERLNRLEHAHNKLANAFQKTERELNIALQSIKHLQQSHMVILSNQVKAEVVLDKLR